MCLRLITAVPFGVASPPAALGTTPAASFHASLCVCTLESFRRIVLPFPAIFLYICMPAEFIRHPVMDCFLFRPGRDQNLLARLRGGGALSGSHSSFTPLARSVRSPALTHPPFQLALTIFAPGPACSGYAAPLKPLFSQAVMISDPLPKIPMGNALKTPANQIQNWMSYKGV